MRAEQPWREPFGVRNGPDFLWARQFMRVPTATADLKLPGLATSNGPPMNRALGSAAKRAGSTARK
jgi:hypothetical protein